MNIYKPHLDRIGIIASLLCLAHCILLPVFFTTLPVWGFEVLENPCLEMLTILTTFFVGGWAIYNGYRRFHQRLVIVLLFLAGLLFMALAGLMEAEAVEILLKGTGTFLVIAAHIRNWRQCQCPSCAVCKT